MNFATVHSDDGKLKFGETELHLSGRAAQAAEQRRGKDIVIGFRPEDMEIANGSPLDGMLRLPAKIDVVEYLGNQELLHAQAEDKEVVALVSSERQVQAGDRVEFTIPQSKLHLFDPETEETLA